MTSEANQWTIRPAREQDTDSLAEIYLGVRRQTFIWVDPVRFHREDFAAHTQGEHIFVCEDSSGTIAGFLTLWEPDDFIHMLYILPAFQGSGAGKALLAALPDWPRRRYRLKCLVRNTRAIAFYRAIGFKIVGDGASPEGDYKDMQLSGD
ncbi:GNAT family N-acetyltransferase [Agrobacterium sp. SHOUNA12C]|uniref:Acetyltransferase protein n=2 Tax=Rhizobium rhizogenes TaxID=359 RepID=B9J888_RHIR8|nr:MULTISPECIES: N-acetyltransferase [Rhizobium]ACM25275.1 acetyltransferase protein [Rhizobium rhizogenes K84]KAA6486983.1 N-acetyltransferase [Agrobacterium sp. ICMP 7243]MCJ9724118.1 GNAT family N-acetyltransferase [Agrobacterium sp. BETTINA12B]MCJ9760210.1 GNAT family N-acetyltransferase [Agrobacterium sp. SHOUNA12C]OCI97904.1 acetyltransferase [Agrobacterium sp. 13-626]OCJ21630.1 acetyltransferase [Agrobacterium sp. B131/95]OCJ26923.1 acetyltransferase [Agrobacterium sp. B133/95]